MEVAFEEVWVEVEAWLEWAVEASWQPLDLPQSPYPNHRADFRRRR